jgi:hypothetical protein
MYVFVHTLFELQVRTFEEGPLSGVLAAVAECEVRLGECMLRLAPQSAALE